MESCSDVTEEADPDPIAEPLSNTIQTLAINVDCEWWRVDVNNIKRHCFLSVF